MSHFCAFWLAQDGLHHVQAGGMSPRPLFWFAQRLRLVRSPVGKPWGGYTESPEGLCPFEASNADGPSTQKTCVHRLLLLLLLRVFPGAPSLDRCLHSLCSFFCCSALSQKTPPLRLLSQDYLLHPVPLSQPAHSLSRPVLFLDLLLRPRLSVLSPPLQVLRRKVHTYACAGCARRREGEGWGTLTSRWIEFAHLNTRTRCRNCFTRPLPNRRILSAYSGW